MIADNPYCPGREHLTAPEFLPAFSKQIFSRMPATCEAYGCAAGECRRPNKCREARALARNYCVVCGGQVRPGERFALVDYIQTTVRVVHWHCRYPGKEFVNRKEKSHE